MRKNALLRDVYVGADPGKTGAIACISYAPSYGWAIRALKTPVVGPTTDWKFDYFRIRRYLSEVGLMWGKPKAGVIEKVHSMPRDGVKQAFSFGRCREALEAAFFFTDVPYEMVPPQTWKKYFELLKKDKSASLSLAQRLFPNSRILVPRNDTKVATKELEGIAEATLMAWYCYKMHEGK